MRILHTADWHIGRQLNHISLIDDQKEILADIIDVIKQEKVDVLIIAGDIYDKSIPSVEAVNLLDWTFSEILLNLDVPIIAIAGNHDNGARLSFASDILKNGKLFIVGGLKENTSDKEKATDKERVPKIVFEDKWGPVNFYPIPYMEPSIVKHLYGNDDIKNHNAAMEAVVRSIEIELNQRNVAIAHGFVIGTENEKPITCESERTLTVGNVESVSYGYFKDFSYTALGHLHCRQKAGEERIRYSGSPLKYSVSEVDHKKGVELVEIDGDGKVSVEFIELKPERDLRVLKGSLEELLGLAGSGKINKYDYIHAKITDEGELLDPIGKLRAVYPNIISLERESPTTKEGDSKTSAGKDFKRKTKLELFKDFYEAMTGYEFGEDKEKIIDRVIREISEAERSE